MTDSQASAQASATWPFNRTTIRSGEYQLSVTDVGEGPTLLFVHVGMWSILWRDLLVELQTDFRCVTLDVPGNGLTTGPNTGKNKIDVAEAAAAVDAVVTQLQLDDMTLVFHDLGGTACLEAATKWPSRVQGIVAVNTFGWRPSGFAFRTMLAMMGSPIMREIDVWTGWLPRMASTRFGVGRNWDKPTRKAFRQNMKHAGRRSFHRYMKAVRKHDFTTIEATVADLSDVPLLTVFGEKNDALKFQPKWAARFADCTQAVVPNGLHFPMCDDPQLVARAIRRWHSSAEIPQSKLKAL